MNTLVSDRLLSDKVYEQLQTALGSEGFEAQARLPGEHTLAEHFGVSRPVLRQALAKLRTEGRIVSRKGSGNYVANVEAPERIVTFGSLKSIPDVRAFLEFRCSLEGEMAAHAARRRDPGEVAAIGRQRKRLDDAVAAGQGGIEEDIAFHAAIAQASGNRFFSMTLAALAEQTRFSIQLIRQLSASPLEDRFDAVKREHASIDAAIAAGDVDAARESMNDHLRSGISRLFS
jgi:GntR family transcriptional repressor for pyruvate dehydrogenase complex